MENPYLVSYNSVITKDLVAIRLSQVNNVVEICWLLNELKTPFFAIDLIMNKNIVLMRKDKAEKMFENQIISSAHETLYV